MFNLSWFTRGLGPPAILWQAKHWNYLTGKRISLPISGALRAHFFPLQTHSRTSNWPFVGFRLGAFAFLSQTRNYFFKESMPHLKTVVGEDDGPLDQGPGEMCWAKKDERKIPSQNASAFFAPLQPLAQNLALSVERTSDLPRVIQLRRVITSAQESLVNKFQLIRIKANN